MSKLLTRISLLVIGGILLSLTGCQLIPWLAQFAPAEKIAPVCDIPPDVRILVLVRDLELSQTADCAAIKRHLTNSLNEQLLEHNVVAEVVPYEDLLDFIEDEPVFHQLSFGEIGRSLDADLVLYIRLNRFNTDTEMGLLRDGELDVRVKLVAPDNHTLWPLGQPGGYAPEEIRIPGTLEESQTYAVKLTEMLAEQMADQIAKLFYEYEVPAGTRARRERQQEDEGA